MYPKVRERYAVLLMPENKKAESFDPGSPPDLGLSSEWVPCDNPRVLALRYEAKEGETLPQAKAVKSVLTAWAKSRGLKKTRLEILDRLEEKELEHLLRAWDTSQKLIGSNVTLAYSVLVPKTARVQSADVDLIQRLCWLAERSLPWMNQQLGELHREEVLEAAPGWRKPVWKHGDLGSSPEWAPSRVGRCLLETVGRLVVSQGTRRQAFTALAAVGEKENLLKQGSLYPLVLEARDLWEAMHEEDREALKAGFLLGVAEQMHADYVRRTERKWDGLTWAEWAALYGEPVPAPMAESYAELQNPPRISRFFLTYAADDGARHGQAARYALADEGKSLDVELLLPDKPDPEANDWSWCSFTLPLPEIVITELARGGRVQSPDLRRLPDGRWVLDLKVEAPPTGERRGKVRRILAFDWGLRKLITAVILEIDEQGNVRQLTRPFFLKVGGIYAKLKELRAHASLLLRKADNLRIRHQTAGPEEQRILAQEEQKTREELTNVWRRYRELQDQLAHQAANFLLTLAQESGCSVVVGEWLGSLKSRNKSHDLNWRINSQIRSVIIEKLKYKARRVGIKVKLIWPRGTSHRCPRCGAESQPVVNRPPHSELRRKPGSYGRTADKPGTKHRPRRYSWFHCQACGYNADRDYAAALNIGIEYYAEEQARAQAREEKKASGRKLAQAAKAYRQAVSYTGAAVARPFTSQNERFPYLSGRHGYRQITSTRQWSCHGGTLCGWRGRRVSVTPYVIPKWLPSTA
ncbi:MAG: transposase [Peptococcaceae bacterium]|jgi:IS605 OrfB family transposase|nr:transposase [Peptococcaceae bacterium]